MKMMLLSIAVLMAGTLSGQYQVSVFFDFNKHELTSREKAKLDSFLTAEKQNLSGLTIGLNGHCDSVGSVLFNEKLAEHRLAAVKKYLISKGFGEGNLGTSYAWGETDPLYENTSAEGRQLNRRVDINLVRDVTLIPGKVKEDVSLSEQIADKTTKAGSNIILKNINFYGGSPYLLPESFPTLDELLEVMKRNPALVIEVQGHICCVPYAGDREYGPSGNSLSEERARAIWAQLIGNGIDSSRVTYKGYGHSQPIYPYPEKSEEERIQNRRVEIRIVSK